MNSQKRCYHFTLIFILIKYQHSMKKKWESQDYYILRRRHCRRDTKKVIKRNQILQIDRDLREDNRIIMHKINRIMEQRHLMIYKWKLVTWHLIVGSFLENTLKMENQFYHLIHIWEQIFHHFGLFKKFKLDKKSMVRM